MPEIITCSRSSADGIFEGMNCERYVDPGEGDSQISYLEIKAKNSCNSKCDIERFMNKVPNIPSTPYDS